MSSSSSSSFSSSSSTRNALRHPIRTLILAFAAWKFFLLLIALASPGRGYDTSTSLVLHAPPQHLQHLQPPTHEIDQTTESGAGPLPAALHYLATKLTRWDAIYFTQAAARGYRFEQEWAFGWGLTKLIALVTAVAHKAGIPHYAGLESIVAIAIAHTAHLLSSLTLFTLSKALFPGSSSSPFALIAALLHVLSPAGLFLSAPYAESSTALLSFLGCLLFTKSRTSSGTSSASHDVLVLAAGMVFGAAATLRSNAILNGLLLLEEAVRSLYDLTNGFSVARVRRLLASGLGGLFVGIGFLLPQYIAYVEYCTTADIQPREWCGRTLPSIYTFVQDHYWNCGPFRYWTISNIPLFLLALPMLFIMAASSMWGFFYEATPVSVDAKVKSPSTPEDSIKGSNAFIVRNLAASQLLLALLTLITAHVQIITRISSACPVWVWCLARPSGGGVKPMVAKHAVTVMIMYGIIQGALFASFLPPA